MPLAFQQALRDEAPVAALHAAGDALVQAPLLAGTVAESLLPAVLVAARRIRRAAHRVRRRFDAHGDGTGQALHLDWRNAPLYFQSSVALGRQLVMVSAAWVAPSQFAPAVEWGVRSR